MKARSTRRFLSRLKYDSPRVGKIMDNNIGVGLNNSDGSSRSGSDDGDNNGRTNSEPANNKFAQRRYANLVPMFISDLTTSASSEQRRNAAQALGRLGDPKAIDPLIAALENDTMLAVRKAAAKALGKLGDARVLPGLLVALAKPVNVMCQRTISKAIERVQQ